VVAQGNNGVLGIASKLPARREGAWIYRKLPICSHSKVSGFNSKANYLQNYQLFRCNAVFLLIYKVYYKGSIAF
jgi:hypothetical protein